MPARPPVPNTCKLEFLWTQNGIPAANVQHFTYSGGPPSSSDLSSFCAGIGAIPMAHVGSLMGPTNVLESVQATDLASDVGAEGSATIATAGTSSNLTLPNSACVMSSLKILRRYRGGHPRAYWPAPDATHLLTRATWDSATVTAYAAMEAAIDAYIVSYLGSTFAGIGRVNVSYFSGKVLRTVPVTDRIVSVSVDGLVRSQRRRLTSSTP